MEGTRETASETSSIYEEFIEMDLKEDAEGLTDNDIQLELDVIKKWGESFNLKGKPSEGNLSKTPLSTPKIKSVVVLPELASNRPNIAVSKSGSKTATVTKQPKRNKNRSVMAKSKAGSSEGSSSTLMALLSKGKMPDREGAQNDKNDLTPVSGKRARSAGTTPEGNSKQPEKVAKFQDVPARKSPDATPKFNLLERRTMNLKVCAAQRPLTSKELHTIKRFLIYQIEQSLEHESDFIPIFTEPCKIGQDGVYVYCANQACANWITHMAATGFPEISERMVILPHETPVTLNPIFINVRVITTIPTRKSKDEILKILARLNRNLNTEKWRITKMRNKGSSNSTVYMRIDKLSFDMITNQAEEGRVNWILGPIKFKKETRESRPKKVKKTEASDGKHLESAKRHFKPPSAGGVDNTTRSTMLNRNEGQIRRDSECANLNDGRPFLQGKREREPQNKMKED